MKQLYLITGLPFHFMPGLLAKKLMKIQQNW